MTEPVTQSTSPNGTLKPILTAIFVMLVAIFGFLLWNSGLTDKLWSVSNAKILKYGDECGAWFEREFGGTYISTTDAWYKDGRLVLDIYTTENSTMLCIVDESTGRMMKPSAFDASNWRKP